MDYVISYKDKITRILLCYKDYWYRLLFCTGVEQGVLEMVGVQVVIKHINCSGGLCWAFL